MALIGRVLLIPGVGRGWTATASSNSDSAALERQRPVVLLSTYSESSLRVRVHHWLLCAGQMARGHVASAAINVALYAPEISPPHGIRPAGDHKLDHVERNDHPEAHSREPMTVDNGLIDVARAPLIHQHSKIDSRDHDQDDALAPIHRSIRNEIYPNCDGMGPSGQDLKDHHGQYAHNHLADYNPLDPLPASLCHSSIENTCICRSGTARPATYLHHIT